MDRIVRSLLTALQSRDFGIDAVYFEVGVGVSFYANFSACRNASRAAYVVA